jgi:flagellar biosynthesis protein FlhB
MMKKSLKVFWVSFAVYSIITFVISLVIERNENNLGFLINMKGYIPIMKYFTFLGLVFFAVAFISMWRSRVSNRKSIDRLQEEKKELKAAMFDLKKETPSVKGVANQPQQEE